MIKVDPALTRLWGKQLTSRDALMLEYYGWARKVSEQRSVHWAITERAKVFDTSLHERGQRRPFHIMKNDIYLTWPMFEGRLPYIGNSRSDLRLAALLNLVDHVTSGHAIYHEAGETLIFVPNLRPPWHLVGLAGGQIAVVTPKGLWGDRLNSQIDELGLRQIMLEFERRRWMQKVSEGRSSRWAPTASGVRAGVDLPDWPAVTLLLEMGLFAEVLQCESHPTWVSRHSGIDCWNILGLDGRPTAPFFRA